MCSVRIVKGIDMVEGGSSELTPDLFTLQRSESPRLAQNTKLPHLEDLCAFIPGGL